MSASDDLNRRVAEAVEKFPGHMLGINPFANPKFAIPNTTDEKENDLINNFLESKDNLAAKKIILEEFFEKFKIYVIKCYNQANAERDRDRQQRKLKDLELIFAVVSQLNDEMIKLNTQIDFKKITQLLDQLTTVSIPLKEKIFSFCFGILGGIIGATIGAVILPFFFLCMINQDEEIIILKLILLLTIVGVIIAHLLIPGGILFLGWLSLLDATVFIAGIATFFCTSPMGAIKGAQYGYNRGSYFSRYCFFNSILNEKDVNTHTEIRTKACDFINSGLNKALQNKKGQEAVWNILHNNCKIPNAIASIITDYHEDANAVPSVSVKGSFL